MPRNPVGRARATRVSGSRTPEPASACTGHSREWLVHADVGIAVHEAPG